MKKTLITKSIRRIAYLNAGAMLGLYLTFLLFTLFILNYVLIDDLDYRLRHEVDHIYNSIEIIDDKVEVIYPGELEEEDLLNVTETPFFLQIYDLEGKIFLRSPNLDNYSEILLGFPNNFSPYYFESFFNQDEHLRTIYKPLINQNKTQIGYLQLSTIHSSFNIVVKNVFWFNTIALPIVIFAIIFLSIFLAKKSYTPINRIIDLANKISATNLSERLDYEATEDDELGKLKNTLNSLFDRLKNQIQEISQFTDNASHQLMTPLTAIKTELDFILKREHPLEEYKETCNILKAQTDRMIAMVRTMLIMSRGCNECSDNTNVFQLSNLLNNEITNIYSSANVNFKIENNIYLRGKLEYFSIIIQNLIDNAIKYSPTDSVVEVSAQSNNGKLLINVIDNGIGIKHEEKTKIFQRFYRVDTDDVNKINGYGLGLSLVKSVIESMGGNIDVKDNIPQGTIFSISVPKVNLS
jgi:signal transduction histidine kinase